MGEIMTKDKIPLRRLGGDKRAVSPAISTVILTSAVVVLLLVTVTFANNFLNARMAENEFSAMKQFMQTVGLQIDDVAWTIGRTQTIRYASKYGRVNFESVALNYTVYVKKDVTWELLLTNTTGMILFNMPIDTYTLGNNYHERVFPSSDGSFLQVGTSAPVSHVFVVEKLPMPDGNYIRIVLAPTIRMLNATINNVNYFKFYLPCLVPGQHPHYSQSVTITGENVYVRTESEVSKVKITVEPFPNEGLGFDSEFFKFDGTEVEIPDLNGSVVEFYSSEVRVSLGLHV
jgi:hypothetical protein